MKRRDANKRGHCSVCPKKMNKRAISAIVATILIILITVAGIVIIWTVILPMITQSLDTPELEGGVEIVSSGGYTVYDPDAEVALVQVRRRTGEADIRRVKISFSFDGNSESIIVDAPGENQALTYAFDVSEYGVPESVEVSPIYTTGDTEKFGIVMSKVNIKESTIADVPTVLLELSCDEDETRTCSSICDAPDGIQYCLDGSWGECSTQQPETEVCDSGLDEDCDGDVDCEDENCGAYLDCTDVLDSLVLRYDFTTNEGSTVSDLSGNGNGGDVTDATWVDGDRSGGAYDFDGNGDYISVSDDNSLDLTSAITISVWVKKEGSETGYAGIVAKDSTGDGDGYGVYYYGSSPKFLARVDTWATTDWDTDLQMDTWTHLVATYDSINMVLYRDGSFVKSEPHSSDINTNTRPLYIGRQEGASYFNGLIDEVRIYNRALTAAEVERVYRLS